MKKKRFGLVGMAMILVFLVSACGPQPSLPTPGGPSGEETPPIEAPMQENQLISNVVRESAPQIPGDDLRELAAGNSAFALGLYRYLTRDDQGNQFYSPYSISLALAMTYAGARGETERQMAEALHFNLEQARLHPSFNALDQRLAGSGQNQEGSDFQLSIANSLWGQEGYPFKQDFLDMLARNYGAGMYVVDYARPDDAGDLINAWVAEKTREKIQDLIPHGVLTQDTRLVLANAIYFNAAWAFPFDANATRSDDFHRLDGRVVQVPLMFQSKTHSYHRFEDFQVVNLPYGSSSISMLIFLPGEGKFQTFEESLDAAMLAAVLPKLQSTQVDLYLPKFSFETRFSLNNALKTLGMPDAFDADVADFTGMTEVRELFISEVVHKAFVDVNEEGTEAAAATGVVVGIESMPAEQVTFRADRPFVFMIIDHSSGSILFIGRLIDPS